MEYKLTISEVEMVFALGAVSNFAPKPCFSLVMADGRVADGRCVSDARYTLLQKLMTLEQAARTKAEAEKNQKGLFDEIGTEKQGRVRSHRIPGGQRKRKGNLGDVRGK